jgi:hypothetical protein
MRSWLVPELLVYSKEFSLFIFTSSRVVIWYKDAKKRAAARDF